MKNVLDNYCADNSGNNFVADVVPIDLYDARIDASSDTVEEKEDFQIVVVFQ